jgi:hypothetical protein
MTSGRSPFIITEPNGFGKCGVVDAIEFGLAGQNGWYFGKAQPACIKPDGWGLPATAHVLITPGVHCVTGSAASPDSDEILALLLSLSNCGESHNRTMAWIAAN